MRVISRRRIREFIMHHPDSESPLLVWYGLVKRAQWRHLADLKSVLPSADLVGARTVFNIGQRYRLIARVNYRTGRVFVLHILTHREYDKGSWKK